MRYLVWDGTKEFEIESDEPLAPLSILVVDEKQYIKRESVKGGPGSGNFGHSGRPGKIGGSGPKSGGLAPLKAPPSLRESGRESKKLQDFLSSKFPVPEDFEAEEVEDMDWSTAEPEVCAAVKSEIVSGLSQTAGVFEDEANGFVYQWAKTSNDTDMRSLSIQETASNEFQVPLSEWQKARIEAAKKLRGLEAKPRFSEETQSKLVRAVYDSTQRGLRKTGFDPDETVRLYRGIKFDERPDWTDGEILDFEGNALESWSVSPEAAAEFSGPGRTILVADVPVRNIYSSARTGPGCLNEGEVIVITTPDSQVMAWIEED